MLFRSVLKWTTAAALLLACNRNEKVTGGSVEENEVLAGTIVLTSGDPVPNAEVRLYTVDHLPAQGSAGEALAFSTRTDAQGRYHVDSLAKGLYNILAAGSGGVSYRDSVFLAPAQHRQVTDTLRSPGSVSGVAALQPNHDPRTITVQALGTDVFTNVGKDGRFTLPGLAAGNYSLRLETTLADYTPLFTGASVRAGAADTLRDTLRLIYTGIPVVTGLRVRLDTLAGVALLTWHPVDYSDLKTYVVLRNLRDPLVPVGDPIAVTKDTSWSDTLFRPQNGDYGLNEGNLPSPQLLEYSVRVRNQSNKEGETYGSATLDAVPFSWAQTFMRLSVSRGEASLHDTVTVIATARNKTRKLIRVRWWINQSDTPVRDRALTQSGESASDTLTMIGDNYGNFFVTCNIEDDHDSTWGLQTSYSIKPFPPRAYAGVDTVVSINDTVRLRGTASTSFGKIIKYEWDVGMTGRFALSVDGSQTVVPVSYSDIRCVLRAMNEDGEIGMDTVLVSTHSFPPTALAGNDTVVSKNDTVRLTGRGSTQYGKITKYEWDVGAQGVFTPSVDGSVIVIAPAAYSTELCVLRVTNSDGETGLDTMQIQVNPFLPKALAGNDTTVGLSDTLYLKGRGQTQYGKIVKYEWDIGATGNFVQSVDGGISFTVADTIGVQPCILRVTNEDGETSQDDTLWLYISLKWKKVADAPAMGNEGQLVVFKDKMWLIGGNEKPGQQSSVFTSTDGINWQPEHDSAVVTRRAGLLAAFVLKDTLCLVKGYDKYAQPPDLWQSADGVHWDSGGDSSLHYSDRIYSAMLNDRVWLWTNQGYPWTSANGRNWTPDSNPYYGYNTLWMIQIEPNRKIGIGQQINIDAVRIWSHDGGTGWAALPIDPEMKNPYPAWTSYANRMWMLNGPISPDLFSSADGQTWHRELSFPRDLHLGRVSVIYHGRLWLIDDGEVFTTR